MFENLKEFFEGAAGLGSDKSGKPTERDLQICVAALLVQMAFSDEHLHEKELTAMIGNLNRQFQLSDYDAADILEVADYLRKNETRLENLLTIINERFEHSQKLTVLAMLWRVMKADGSVNTFEARLAAEVSSHLGLSEAEIEQARIMAETGAV